MVISLFYKIKQVWLQVLLLSMVPTACHAQAEPGDTIDYRKVYAMGLKADVRPIMAYLDTLVLTDQKDIAFKDRFLLRFKGPRETSSNTIAPDIYALKSLFQDYWRKGLLDPGTNFDHELKSDLVALLNDSNVEDPFYWGTITVEYLKPALRRFVSFKDLYATDFGKTGKFYDLLLWKTQYTEKRPVDLLDTTLTVPIHFMDDFVSLGWLEYVRMGNYHPGGWANDKGLFCVTKGYDLRSEKFDVHFLKHEAQHFADKGRFGDLSDVRLEYRAKLMELYYGEDTLFETLQKFIMTAKEDLSNAHPYANWLLIGALSEQVFGEVFVKEIDRWQQVSPEEIRKLAKELYLKDTRALNRR